MTSIMNMFARSPLQPLQEHMQSAHECATTLPNFFNAVIQQDWAQAQSHQEKIIALEKKADALKRDLRLHLPTGLFLPVNRNDVLNLLILQDNIANLTEDVAGIIVSRRMVFPERLQAMLLELVEKCVCASEQANSAIHELEQLAEAGFRGNERDVLVKMIQGLDIIEHETDDLQVNVRDALFEIESTLNPIEVIFMYKVIEWLGEIADTADRVGGQLQLLVAN